MPAPRNHPHRWRGFFAQSGAGHPHPYLRMHEGGQPRGPAAVARQRSRPAVAPHHARGTGPALRPAQRNAPRHRLSQKRQSRLLPDAPAPFPRQVRPEAARDGYAHGHLPPGGQSQEGGGKINGQGLREQGPRPCPWANSSTQPPAAKAKRICTGSSQSAPTRPRRHASGRTAGSSFFRTAAG